MSKLDTKFAVGTVAVALVLTAAGFVAGCVVAGVSSYHKGWEVGFDAGVERGKYYAAHDTDSEYIRGLHAGVEASEQTLYATCEDETIASQYPAGFCEGVNAYLGI